jgi:hypothetical protein
MVYCGVIRNGKDVFLIDKPKWSQSRGNWNPRKLNFGKDGRAKEVFALSWYAMRFYKDGTLAWRITDKLDLATLETWLRSHPGTQWYYSDPNSPDS